MPQSVWTSGIVRAQTAGRREEGEGGGGEGRGGVMRGCADAGRARAGCGPGADHSAGVPDMKRATSGSVITSPGRSGRVRYSPSRVVIRLSATYVWPGENAPEPRSITAES